MRSAVGMPDPIGMAAPKPAASPMGAEPDGDEMGGCKLDAMTVGYHEEARNCGNCEHNQNGQCEVIGQQVSPEGGCMVWEGADADDTGDMGADGPDDSGAGMPGGGAPAMSGGYGS